MSVPKKVAVVVPLSAQTWFSPDEEISLRQLEDHLGAYDRYFVAPPGLPTRRSGFRVKRFPRKYFGSIRAHTRLMLSKRFYRAFRNYEFVLIYHLDALVFSSDLGTWCDRGFDYLGAPWLRSAEEPERGFSGVGNGGFSLRRVKACLRVLESRRYKLAPAEFWARYHADQPLRTRIKYLPKRWLKHIRRVNGVEWEIRHWGENEDKFWSRRAAHYHPGFRIAPVEDALDFAFECAPRYCYERNGTSLPFGCHAWARYDREFWEPFLLTDTDAGDCSVPAPSQAT